MNQSPYIIGLVGHPASGKGTVAAELIAHHDAVSFRYSTMLRDILTRLHLPHDREHIAATSHMIRETFGSDIMSRVIAEDAKQSSAPIVIVDGIRRMEDIIHLKDNPKFMLVAIEASMQTRYERLIARTENTDDQTKTFEQFKADHLHESDREVDEVITHAQIRIDNNGSADTLREQIDTLVASFSHEC
jgi:dephospho-CoA kinase